MMPMADAVANLFKVYGRNPAALVTALQALVSSQVEQREARSVKELAAATCRHLHPEPSDRVACGSCFEAALERINGQ